MTEAQTETIRAERQTKVDSQVYNLRADAERIDAEADRLRATVNPDSAFWTQPAYGNAAGRSFARQRDRERSKVVKAGELAAQAAELRSKADRIEARGAVVAGDADAVRKAAADALTVSVGDMVNTTFYGVRTVLKVNKASISVQGDIGPIKVEKHFVSRVGASA